ncbi:MAG: DUF4231 domain-containing protein [Acidobacteria bacterium]|nr:DUF4231 domain-containing protein [Acidobacteriota bacterium]
MSDSTPTSNPSVPANPTLERLNDQINWYDKKSGTSQSWYKCLKALTMVSAVLIPLASTAEGWRLVSGFLGVVIVLAEGFQQLNQFHINWIAYRTACESLKRERHLFLAQAGPYATVEKPTTLLAERMEGLLAQENDKWVSTQLEAGKKALTAKTP